MNFRFFERTAACRETRGRGSLTASGARQMRPHGAYPVAKSN